MEAYNKALLNHLAQFVRPERYTLFRKVVAERTRYLTVLLEDIYQSQNASAVLRTCDCVGIQDVHIVENRNAYEINRDVALGSNQWLSLHYYRDDRDRFSQEDAQARNLKPGAWVRPGEKYIEKAVSALKNEGYRIVATSPHQEGRSPETFDLEQGPAALMFGTELTGLSEQALSLADEYIQIPMDGFTESYNISVSAAIVMYSLRRRLENCQAEWRMRESAQDSLLLEWLRTSVKKSDLIEKAFRKEWD